MVGDDQIKLDRFSFSIAIYILEMELLDRIQSIEPSKLLICIYFQFEKGHSR
jgi:hypothetical protein